MFIFNKTKEKIFLFYLKFCSFIRFEHLLEILKNKIHEIIFYILLLYLLLKNIV